MTVQFCVEVCRGTDMTIALIHVEKCYCTKSRGELVVLPQYLCAYESSCPGNPLQNCGSADKSTFAVYEVEGFSHSSGQEIGKSYLNP